MSSDPAFVPYRPGILAEDGTQVGTHDPRLVRTNYFDGQLLKASDLTRDQTYLDERLLEVGQILGSGIARGLETSLLEGHRLRVRPGMAVAPSGRVLQLEGADLVVDLLDIAQLVSINEGKVRRLQRGLYAVALQYADVIADVAESYPTLDGKRRGHVGLWAEGVELTLVPLPLDLPEGDGLALRSALARRLIGTGQGLTLPGDETVALGLLAIDRTGAPAWLDQGLVRRPLRPAHAPFAVQDDLACHHQELFEDVLQARAERGLGSLFAAVQHFQLLPPFGPVPKAALDPVEARQSYFPEAFDVSVAPVRRCDLPSLLEDARSLAPIDLARDKDIDLLILVPMDDRSFAERARQLELRVRASDAVEPYPQLRPRILRALDALTLRLLPRPMPHKYAEDVAVWRAIWDATKEHELVYVRRPPRAAETQVSGIVLAQGFDPVDFAQSDVERVEAERDAALARAQQAETDLGIATLAKAHLEKTLSELQAQLAAAQAIHTADLAAVQALEAELKAAGELRLRLQREIEALQAQLEQQQGMRLADVAALRGVMSREAMKLDEQLARIPEAHRAALSLAVLAPPASDKLLWATLLRLSEKPEALPKLLEVVMTETQAGAPYARVMAKHGPDIGLDPALVEAWAALVP